MLLGGYDVAIAFGRVRRRKSRERRSRSFAEALWALVLPLPRESTSMPGQASGLEE